MESSEDDAGTATNASRRASAREKDVGLAEDVNATSSFQQKPSEERSSGETPAMSEDNFDGDSVPSPSSQDVNTSTEAILDMIDEIVDGPDAPKRLPLPSEFVEGLNEALATASYNLNIIQESAAKSHSENITLPQITLPVNSVPADCEIPLPETIDTPSECPTISEISTDLVNVKSVASLPASSSVPEVVQTVVSTKPENSVVSNVETETSTSCPLPNIPSSSEEQTVQTVSDTSVSEPQDRTVKCVTSSDSRDNVTVESAESTSSDSSVSESKTLFVEPQVRSPLRRRLVRPVPSDRRPDSTVSSTVDSQNINDNIATAEQSSSENITKDVTSSSDAVPIIHGNVKPEEISNVSEINFCIAETSVSPKKIKLIRHKSTGIINRETPLNIIKVLTENEQCQSTSRDNSVNLSHSTTESSSTVSILQSQDTNENLLVGTNSVLEKQLETPSSDKECHNEHPQPTSAVQPSHNKDDLHQGSNCEQSKPVEASLASVTHSSQCNSEQEMQSLPISQSIKQTTDIKINDLEQGSNCNTHDNEDYIPLHLPPNSKILQSKSRDLKLRSELNPEYNEPESITTDHGVKRNEIESSSGEQNSCSNELHSKGNELELKGDGLESQSNELDSMPSQQEVKNEPQSLSSDIEPKSSMVKLKNIVPKVNTEESKCIELDSKSHKLDSHEPDTLSSVCDTKSNMPDSESSELVSKTCDLESTSSDLLSRKDLNSESSEKTIQLQLDSSRLNTEILAHKSDIAHSSEQQSSSSTELNISKNEAQSSESCESSSSEIDSENKMLALSNEVQPEDSIVKTESSNIDLKECIDAGKTELKSNTCKLEPNSSKIESQSNLLKSQSSQPKSTEAEPKNSEPKSSVNVSVNCQSDCTDEQTQGDLKKVAPFKLNLPKSSISESKLESQHSSINKNNILHEESDSTKQVPKLTIKLKQPEEVKSPVPKLTIKPIKVPVEQSEDKIDNVLQVPCVKKINIKPIVKPDNMNDKPMKSQLEVDKDVKISQQVPCITKLNIKPILKPPEKINDIHRKSSSSEISESECSENDETTSTSDQASASDQGPSDVVPKVTIKLGKPGTESEGKFYTEKNVPKLTIKGIKQEEKVIISQSEDTHSEKVPKLTIKTVTKTEGQPLSPKLTIKPLKPPDSPNKEGEVPKVKIITESFSSSIDGRESPHVPKITIKPVTRADGEARTPKKSTAIGDTSEHIHAISKLNIKPILKPAESEESSESFEDKVPVVSKINIKPVVKPKDNDLDASIVEVPKITKLNIKPIKYPEDNSSEEKDCDELNAVIDENSIPVVTKLNIKPIVKPEEENEKDSENLSSETGNSSDDNGDHIPVVTKLNIKPIVKPDELQETSKSVSSNEQSIPVVTKLNIKPLIKPGESSPSSPKKEHKMDIHSTSIPVVTKLNIKPVVRPEDTEVAKIKDDNEDKVAKNPPLVMKINMKSVTENVNHESTHNENECNDVSEDLKSGKVEKYSEKHENQSHESESVKESLESRITIHPAVEKSLIQNCVPETIQKHEENLRTSVIKKPSLNTPIAEVKLEKLNLPEIAAALKGDSAQAGSKLQDSHPTMEGKISIPNETHISQEQKNINFKSVEITELNVKQPLDSKKTSTQNCTLLKKLLENTQGPLEKFEATQFMNFTSQTVRSEPTIAPCKNIVNSDNVVESGKSSLDKTSVNSEEKVHKSSIPSKFNDQNKIDSGKFHSIQELTDTVIDNITKPLEITISDKLTNQSSGQDSPRIILKINKTDHGPSAKIITEDVKRPDTPKDYVENTQDIVNDKQSPKRHVANSRRKQETDTSLNLSTGKRLRSSRIVENTDKSQVKRHIGKRPSTAEVNTPQNKESELTILQSKRLKLGQLLSGNKSLSIPPPLSPQTSPTKTALESNPVVKPVNHSLLNNENCSKNGNSKLHNILSNLQAKQIQSLSINNTNCSEKAHTVASDIEFNASMSSSDTVEVAPVKNSHLELQQMIINENSDFRDLSAPEESSQDPLEVVAVKPMEKVVEIPKPVELTPQPKKRGRPRKVPLSEPPKPVVVTLPVPALEERPQRSLRLMRDRPTILSKPRGRGRGRGGRRAEIPPPVEESVIITNIEPSSEETPVRTPERTPTSEIDDPTSSRIKLPRMTEALDKMPSMCTTPLTSRRRSSSGTFSTEDTPDLKVTMDSPLPKDEFPNTPEPGSSGRRRGRGSRGGRGRTPRGRGRGRGGGRGAMYMKETLGIYGRVCGPATTTVQLFEEETCMMDDNATPAKPSHLLDEDSLSSVKSSTNESNKMKKSKFADLFDSNKVWTAADVKEYMWQSEKDDGQQKVMMIQEQVAMFLGVKSFKRRYPELKRRTIYGEERDYILSKGLVSEALCDLGITAVDASEVLDIMLSDYPHKYEEYRSHQRQRQLTGTPEESMEESKLEEKAVKVEIKAEKPVEQKPELPKVDPEKTRLDMAAAAIASASEWNARANAARRGACADLQSLSVLRPRAPPVAPARPHLRPPAGFYPHALLPGQYQHSYRVYTPDQLRYFPLNTVLAAPPAPPSVTDESSESEPEWGSRCTSSDDSDVPAHHSAKRKKLTKVKRVSNLEASASVVKEEPRDEVVDLCRVCKLRLEANRRYTHERFLVCSNCDAKLHPSCLELNADTIRKCREYAWQCAECKTCCSCRQPADDDKMLFCDLCDRGFHIYCVGLDTVPSGRWHCVSCAVCKSCGARSPEGLPAAPGTAPAAGPNVTADWHHQTRRGPGGHKVYSHSLCTPCARAYRIGRYCPLCERSFIGPKGTMQLVICKLCDRQLHQDCVRRTVPALRVLDYTCAECRRGGITSRAAAVRLAPRTIATLFMAKRRFNKYAHRQYMQSRLREMAAADAPDDNSVDLPDDAFDAPAELDAGDPLDGRPELDAGDPLDGRPELDAGDPLDGRPELDAGDPLDGRPELDAGDPLDGRPELDAGDPLDGRPELDAGDPLDGRPELDAGDPLDGRPELDAGDPLDGRPELDAGDPLDGRPELDAGDPLDLPAERDGPDAPE